MGEAAQAAEAAAEGVAKKTFNYTGTLTFGISKVTRTAWNVGWGLVAFGVAGDFAMLAVKQISKGAN